MIEQPFEFKKSNVETSGIVTLKSWMMMQDGQTALYIWAPRWEIIPDNEMPVKKLKTTERWTLAAVNSIGTISLLIPGCGVFGWSFCKEQPICGRRDIYFVK